MIDELRARGIIVKSPSARGVAEEAPGAYKDVGAVVEAADGMLVVGSSLMVFSGFRLVRQAAERRLSIQVINQGRTRADELVDFKLAAPCAEVLNAVAAELGC